MTLPDFLFLIDKYLKNTISEEETDALEELLKEPKNAEVFKNLIKDDYLLKTANREFDVRTALKKSTLEFESQPVRPIWYRQPLYKYAASVLLIVGLTFLGKSILATNPHNDSPIISADEQVRLEFDDGNQQFLTETESDSILGTQNNLIGLVNNGKLRYTKGNPTATYNTLRVPYGKRFQVQLSDGTTVHLNAGSSLRYPISFSGASLREVQLEGEAYFDVAKDSIKRFVVKSQDLGIEVLGTQFNINSYTEDTEIHTTLREGSVRILSNSSTLIMAPNEQVVLVKQSHELIKRKVNADRYIAWVQGETVFTNTPFKKILKTLERKYHVQINSSIAELNDQRFTARFDGETIEQIIDYFSKSYGFDYGIENNKITINNKK